VSNRHCFQCIILIYIGLTRVPLLAWLVIHGWVFQLLGSVLLGTVLGWRLRPTVQGRGWRMLPLSMVLVGAAVLIDDVLTWGVMDLTITTLILAGRPKETEAGPRACTLDTSAMVCRDSLVQVSKTNGLMVQSDEKVPHSVTFAAGITGIRTSTRGCSERLTEA